MAIYFKKDYHIDHIYCINYLPNNRLYKIKRELNFVGINYNDGREFSFEFDYDFNLNNMDDFYENVIKVYNLKKNELKLYDNKLVPKTIKLCIRNYSIFKKALALGYEKIAILEDDINFLKDINFIKVILDHIKWDNDIVVLSPSCLFSEFRNPKYIDLYKKVYNYDEFNVYNKITRLWDLYSAGFNVYSKKAIEAAVWIMENLTLFSPDCLYWYSAYKEDIKICSTIFPICVQDSDYELVEKFNTTKKDMYRNYKEETNKEE